MTIKACSGAKLQSKVKILARSGLKELVAKLELSLQRNLKNSSLIKLK